MNVVMFELRENLSKEHQDNTLLQVSSMSEVRSSGRLHPESTHQEVQQICFAYIEDGGEVESVRAQIEQLPGVAFASIPAERYLEV